MAGNGGSLALVGNLFSLRPYLPLMNDLLLKYTYQRSIKTIS
jgi:hypothetical protein